MLTWACYYWFNGVERFRILQPRGAMWYLLALFMWRLVCEGLANVRFIIPITILLGLYAGTSDDFSAFLSTSRFVVFLPFFMMGYFWKREWTDALRKSYYKWLLLAAGILILIIVVKLMSEGSVSISLFRQNQSYYKSEVSNSFGLFMRAVMYLGASVIIVSLLSFIPNKQSVLTFLGENTMTIYLFHYPIFIVLDGLKVLEDYRVATLAGSAILTVAVTLLLGNKAVARFYSITMAGINKLLFK